MELETAQKMIRYAFTVMCNQFGLDQTTQLQEFLGTIDNDYMLTELEDFVGRPSEIYITTVEWIKLIEKRGMDREMLRNMFKADKEDEEEK